RLRDRNPRRLRRRPDPAGDGGAVAARPLITAEAGATDLRRAPMCRAQPRWPVSAAPEPATPPVPRLLPLAEEGRVVHRLAVRVLVQHVPDVVVVVGHAAAQACGLDQSSPHHLVGGEVVEGDELATHHRYIVCCSAVSGTYAVSRSVRTALVRALRMATIE